MILQSLFFAKLWSHASNVNTFIIFFYILSQACSFSADGKLLASASDDQTVSIAMLSLGSFFLFVAVLFFLISVFPFMADKVFLLPGARPCNELKEIPFLFVIHCCHLFFI